MYSVSSLISRRVALFFAACFLSLLLAPSIKAQLTAPGNDAVYNTSGHTVLSPAFIDASVFLPPQSNDASDVCDAIYQILNGNPEFLKYGYPASGAVIDTRGVGTQNLTERWLF